MLFALCLLLGASRALAQVRIGADAGYGNADVNVEGIGFNEGPGSFSAFIEYPLHSRLSVGAQHVRSLKNDAGEVSTAVSLTGLTARWYPLSSGPSGGESALRAVKESIKSENIALFVQGAAGFSQTSLRTKRVEDRGKGTSVGVYLGVETGLELPLTGQLGLMSVLGFNRTIMGTGTLQMLTATMGFYFIF